MPYSLKQYKELPDSMVFMIDNSEIMKNTLESKNIKYVVCKAGDLPKLINHKFDIMIFNSPSLPLHKFKGVKIVRHFYGYSKETYAYNPWIALSDLVLCYGPYSQMKSSKYAQAISVGCPRYDILYDKQFLSKVGDRFKLLNNGKKTILYSPTWSKLSSADIYKDAIVSLSNKYNVLIKLHRNTMRFKNENKRLSQYMEIINDRGTLVDSYEINKKSKNDLYLFDQNNSIIDLIYVSDCVITDYSSSIFDAFFQKKPILLLNIPNPTKVAYEWTNPNSAEILYRDKLGMQVNSPSEVRNAIPHLLNDFVFQEEKLYKDLYYSDPGAAKRAVKAMEDLNNHKFKRTPVQRKYHIYALKCAQKFPIFKYIKMTAKR